MAVRKRLIVGLGNPGETYRLTRHNVGYQVIDVLAERMKFDLKTKGSTLIGWGKWKGRPVGLCKPTAYMNRSGLAIEQLSRKKQLKSEEIFVIVDDINLPIGKVRIRERGGDGGHNGLEDIIDWLDTDSFPRLRIGIGSEYARGGQADYVLSPFSQEEKVQVDEAILIARDAVLTFVSDGIVTAMNRFSK